MTINPTEFNRFAVKEWPLPLWLTSVRVSQNPRQSRQLPVTDCFVEFQAAGGLELEIERRRPLDLAAGRLRLQVILRGDLDQEREIGVRHQMATLV